MIIVNGFQPLIVITKRSILDVAAMLKLVIVIASKYFKLVQHFILSFGSNARQGVLSRISFSKRLL